MSSLISRVKSAYKLHTWQGKILFTLSLVLLLVVLIRIVLTPSIIYATTSWLNDQGIDAEIEDISLSIFNGTVSLINAEGQTDGQALFHIGLVDIHWSWTPLSNKTIEVTKVELDSFEANIAQYTDKLVIGGVIIPVGKNIDTESNIDADTSQPSTTDSARPWAANIGVVTFKKLNVCYLQHSSTQEAATETNRQLDYCVKLDEMLWSGSVSYASSQALIDGGDIPLTSTGDFTLNGLTITDRRLNKTLLHSTSNSIKNVSINGLNNIVIPNITMRDLSALERDEVKHKDTLRFKQLELTNIQLDNTNQLSINTIKVEEPGIYLVKDNDNNWEYQRWVPLIEQSSNADSIKNTQSETPGNTTSATSFTFKLSQFEINKPDLCYLDQTTALYYCYTQNDFIWSGDIAFSTDATASGHPNISLAGDLSISNPRLRNHTLQRDLLLIDSIDLKQLSIKDDLNATLDSFTVENFNALQRTNNATDFISRFSSLAINNINYHNNAIDIDTITLDDLQSTLSKNKDGNFEHEKWFISTTNKESDKKPAADSNDKQAKQPPITYAINKLTVNTDKKIQYIDNSTLPVMNVGLQQLKLNIAELNPEKPNHDSPMELYAQTSRHSTIDVKGTARPFASKVSMDIAGDLKGFDLRAVTPATKQAIGHIIKSGQMDAEIKLLAKEGQLDSNIALSLYHFNIESMSKKDSEALDKQFGMPLNQTLTLLRDKDDSIHLDIPITGDINNPSFDPMDAIIKATSKAATVTLITFYTPYGLVYAGGNVLVDLATAMNFDPVTFEAGKADLTSDAKEQLIKTAELLSEKPQLHMTLCGLTNRNDVFALYPELVKDNKKTSEQKEGYSLTLSDTQQAGLKSLSQSREEVIKDHLIKKLEITHERLILCEPTHSNEKDAISGVEINI